jgi:PBSX family phage terminase large subunit
MTPTLVDLDAIRRAMSDAQIRSIAYAPRHKVALWEGSVSAGKTVASLWAFLFALRQAPTNGLVVVIGKTLQTIYQNLFTLLQSDEIFGALAAQVKYTPGATSARILGREVMVLGANDAKSEGKIRGATVALAYVDEATLLPEGFWPMLLTRLRVPGARLLATTNPGPRNHWLRKDYILRADQIGMQVFSFTMADNPSLDPAYVADMERSFTGVFYERYILGRWTNAEGAIYDMWDPAKHVTPWATLPSMSRLFACGVDYGTTNATAALRFGLGDDGRLYLTDEWRHDSRAGQARWTDGQLSKGLREWLATPPTPHGPQDVEWIVVDPSAASFKLQLFNDGQSNVMAGNNSVVDGIRTVASLLAAERLAVSDRCPGFIDEAPGYAWDPKATEAGKDAPIKERDHSMDAGRYAVHSTAVLWRPFTREVKTSAAA